MNAEALRKTEPSRHNACIFGPYRGLLHGTPSKKKTWIRTGEAIDWNSNASSLLKSQALKNIAPQTLYIPNWKQRRTPENVR